MKIERTAIFQCELAKLAKKFRTLPEDLKVAEKNAILLMHVNKIDNKSVALLTASEDQKIKIYKLRKFACRSLKDRGVKSGIRVIYACHEMDKKIVYLEIYFKGKKENEDRRRIQEYLSRIMDRSIN